MAGLFVVCHGDRCFFGLSQKTGDRGISRQSHGASYPENHSPELLCIYARAGYRVLGENKENKGKEGIKAIKALGEDRLKKLGIRVHYNFPLSVYEI